MEHTAALPRPELLQVADAVARDKGIEKDEVLTAMEFAIQKDVLDGVEQTLRAEFMNNLARSSRRDSHELIAEISIS